MPAPLVSAPLPAASRPLALDAQDLRLRYGSTDAVRGVSLRVAPGEIVALIGPNGAGKSSTLYMLTGLVPPDHGTVWIAGHRLTSTAMAARQALGYIPDRPDVYEHLSLREYIHFVAGLYGVSPDEADAAVAAYLPRFELAGREDDLLGGFSHGMRQKAVLLAALAHRPQLLVLDEPIVGLDPTGARTLLAVLREEAARGMAVLFSTHLLSVAEGIAHRVVCIANGQVIADGTLASLRALATSRAGGAEAESIRDLEDVFFSLLTADRGARPDDAREAGA